VGNTIDADQKEKKNLEELVIYGLKAWLHTPITP